MSDYTFDAEGPTLTVRVGPEVVARLSLAIPLDAITRWWESYIEGGSIFDAHTIYRECMSKADASAVRKIESADGLAAAVVTDAWARALYERLGKLRWSPSSGATTPQTSQTDSGIDSESEPTSGVETPT